MFELFSENARRTVVLAQEQCRTLHHDYIRVEHMLLALMSQGLAGGTERVHAAQEDLLARHPALRKEPNGHIPFTPGTKDALHLAVVEAVRRGDRMVEPTDLLVGVLGCADDGAGRCVRAVGLDPDELVAEARRTSPAEPSGPSERTIAPKRRAMPAGETGRSRSWPVDRVAGLLRRFGRHDDGCAGGAQCWCGLQAVLDELNHDGGG